MPKRKRRESERAVPKRRAILSSAARVAPPELAFRPDDEPSSQEVVTLTMLPDEMIAWIVRMIPPDDRFAASLVCVLFRRSVKEMPSQRLGTRTDPTSMWTSPARLGWAKSVGMRRKPHHYFHAAYCGELATLQSCVETLQKRSQSHARSARRQNDFVVQALCGAVEGNRMDVLQWILRVCQPSRRLYDMERVTNAAAKRGNVPMLQFLRKHHFPFDKKAALLAAQFGHVDALEWLACNTDVTQMVEYELSVWSCSAGTTGALLWTLTETNAVLMVRQCLYASILAGSYDVYCLITERYGSAQTADIWVSVNWSRVELTLKSLDILKHAYAKHPYVGFWASAPGLLRRASEVAARSGCSATVEWLLDVAAGLDWVWRDVARNAVRGAARGGHAPVLRLLFDRYRSSIEFCSICDFHGGGLGAIAVQSGDLETVRCVFEECESGPFHHAPYYAARFGYLDILEWLGRLQVFESNMARAVVVAWGYKQWHVVNWILTQPRWREGALKLLQGDMWKRVDEIHISGFHVCKKCQLPTWPQDEPTWIWRLRLAGATRGRAD